MATKAEKRDALRSEQGFLRLSAKSKWEKRHSDRFFSRVKNKMREFGLEMKYVSNAKRTLYVLILQSMFLSIIKFFA
jgi:hypothetical protein